jgi:hypothetical protein
MNKKWTPHGITAGAFVVFIVLGLACASSPEPPSAPSVVYTGENEPWLSGTKWSEKYPWSKEEGFSHIYEFLEGGMVMIYDSSDNFETANLYGTWERRGTTFKMANSTDSKVGELHTDFIRGKSSNYTGGGYQFTLIKIE